MQKNKKHSEIEQIQAADLMPKDSNIVRILQQRAQFLAKPRMKYDEHEKLVANLKYLCFNLGNTHEQYGLPYQYIKEVINNIHLTKLPLVPRHIAGVINRHGTLITVIDLKHFFHTKLSEYNKDAYIIVITVNDTTIGILADSIEGSNTYDPTKLDPPFSFLDIIKPELIIGLDRGVTAIINIEALVLSPELQVKK